MNQAQLNAYSPEVRNAIAGRGYGNQKVLLELPYYSMVRFAASRAAGPPVVLTIDTTTRTAFSYGIGQSMTAAGFATGNATQAETNLIRGSETRDQADVFIYGMSMCVQPESEPALLRHILRDVAVSISLNGNSSIPIGKIEQYPGGGGLYGSGVSAIKTPDLVTQGGGSTDNGGGAFMSFVQNGNPVSGNFARFKNPFIWSGVGKGSDSSLGILFTPTRTITETCGAVRAAASGILAFTPPGAAGDLGTFVDIAVRLYCVSVADRGVNT